MRSIFNNFNLERGGRYRIAIGDFGINRIVRIDGEQEQVVYTLEDGLNEIIEEEQTTRKISTLETFQEEKCVICLENVKPNILFCDCGHIPICDNCDNLKSIDKCPSCRKECSIKCKI